LEAGAQCRLGDHDRAEGRRRGNGRQDASTTVDGVYHALKRGVGRERVTDLNVDALIALAQERGDTKLEVLLREWRSPCGDDPDKAALS
jgi:hypothetical protein